MTSTRALLGLVLWIAAFTHPHVDADAVGWDTGVAPESVFRNDADIALAKWGLSRFEHAGLVLPEVSLAFHDDKRRCQGHNGYFHPGRPHRIDICGFNWDRFLVTPRKVMLHELAHVWLHNNLDEEAREAFLELRGLDIWQDAQAQWAEQGQEHAAEIMAWGLMDEEISMTSIGETDLSKLEEVFDALVST
jgi:hypothetical protein